MPKFLVKDTIACWVTWTHEIEAKDADEAKSRYRDGDHDAAIETIIGDCIDYEPMSLKIEPA